MNPVNQPHTVVLVDVQAMQTPDSRDRGIGRYSRSLLTTMIERKPASWEFHLLVNGAMADSAAQIRREFAPLVGAERIHSFWSVEAIDPADHTAKARKHASSVIRDAKIAQLSPDILVATSLMELHAVTYRSTELAALAPPLRAAILYDLIPLKFDDIYLTIEQKRQSYGACLREMREQDLLLSISQASLDDAVKFDVLGRDSIVNISGAPDHQFEHAPLDESEMARVVRLYGLEDGFVLYTGGIDYRKNIETLISAFEKLSQNGRPEKLVIVCKINEAQKEQLLDASGLSGHPPWLVLTGFIPEEHLIALYRKTSLFVFPSWYEGLGLPILEAAACGAPVISARNSSMVEIVDFEPAFFDAFDPEEIAAKILQGLSDAVFREALHSNTQRIRREFTWHRSADLALKALESALAQQRARTQPSIHTPVGTTGRVMMFSPLPPARSGIADYADDIVRDIAARARLTLACSQANVTSLNAHTAGAVENPATSTPRFEQYDRVIYQIGNSSFHTDILESAATYPGIAVVHDGSMSGLLSYELRVHDNNRMFKSLQTSHGLHGVLDLVAAGTEYNQIRRIERKYSLTADILAAASAVVVHSDFARDKLLSIGGQQAAQKITRAALPRVERERAERNRTRDRLAIARTGFVVCSFGFVHTTKKSLEIVNAWGRILPQLPPQSMLVLVGHCDDATYRQAIDRAIAHHDMAGSVRLLGFVDRDTYSAHLDACDLAIQLRAEANGETSAGLMDCIASAIPTIVTGIGSFADADIVGITHQLPQKAGVNEIADAILDLQRDAPRREALSARMAAFFDSDLRTSLYAEKLLAAEDAPRNNSNGRWFAEVARLIGRHVPAVAGDFDRVTVAHALRQTFPPDVPRKRVVFDVSLFSLLRWDVHWYLDLLRTAYADPWFQADGRSMDLMNGNNPAAALPLSAAAAIMDIDHKLLPRIALEPEMYSASAIILPLLNAITPDVLRSLEDAAAAGARIIILLDLAMLDLLAEQQDQHDKRLTSLLKLAPFIIGIGHGIDQPVTEMLNALATRANWGRAAPVNAMLRHVPDAAELLAVLRATIAEGDAAGPGAWQAWSPPGFRTYMAAIAPIRPAQAIPVGRALWSAGQDGIFSFGPYARFTAGDYHLVVTGTGVQFEGGFVEVFSQIRGRDHQFAKITFSMHGDDVIGEGSFHLPTDIEAIEFRIFASRRCVFTVSSIRVEPVLDGA